MKDCKMFSIEPVFFSHFSFIDQNVLEMTEKNLSHFGRKV